MLKLEFAAMSFLTILSLGACGSSRDVSFSQPRAISADMSASLDRAPTSMNPSFGIRFTDDLDASFNRGGRSSAPGLGFR